MNPLFSLTRCLAAASIAVLAIGCSTTDSSPRVGTVYSAPTYETVTVVNRTTERVAASQGRVGGQVGSIAGGFGGIAGSVAGGLIGPAVEKAVVRKRASNYTLRKADGTTVTLLQHDEGAPINIGKRAYLIKTSTGENRLVATLPASGA